MSETFALRRSRVLAALGEPAGALVVAAAPALRTRGGADVRYAPDADVYYLTGLVEPDAVLVLCPSAEQPFTLFVLPRDPEQERWTGPRPDAERAREQCGADAVHSVVELAERLPKLVAGADVLFASPVSDRAEVDAAVQAALATARRERPRKGRGPHTVTDLRVLLAPMRMRKDAGEVERLRDAARITVRAFAGMAARLTQAAGEWEVEATLDHGFRSAGADGPAFPTIAAAGGNATVLHYTRNDAPIRPGQLVLVDGGARHRMYCGDVSRTFPAGGTFTAAQRDAYDVVQRARDAAMAAVAPGAAADVLHHDAVKILVGGMKDLGLLDGSVDGIIEKREYRKYFPHQTSHWLGLDVHDPGDYVASDGSPVALEPGMVLTVEPGLYIPADDEAAPAELRGTGIRIEDDVLVTGDGHEVLTALLPAAAADIESLLAG
ncbi:MAG TPA: aminopeptidase P N-terminal domain-containing protein [Longimicrobiales bacterium]|nr:aminopeptidase P N-terminal domain-containing protein [Longimicrobiales bacterium]